MSLIPQGLETSAPPAAQAGLRAFYFLGLALLFFAAAVPGGAASAAQAPQEQGKQSSGKVSGKTSGKTSGKAHPTKHSRSKSNSRGSHARERAQRVPTPERISQVQAALSGAGHYSGQPTGKWDASTVQAMKQYQQANGLPATGKLDAHTLQKLGLGSPIAGVAAPHPPATAPALQAPPE